MTLKLVSPGAPPLDDGVRQLPQQGAGAGAPRGGGILPSRRLRRHREQHRSSQTLQVGLASVIVLVITGNCLIKILSRGSNIMVTFYHDYNKCTITDCSQ